MYGFTMSAKSLGTLPVIYAVDEQQNPLPCKTMPCGGDTNSTGGENDVFPRSLGLRLSIQHCITGEEGSQLLFLQRKKDRGRKFLPLHGRSKGFWQTLSDFQIEGRQVEFWQFLIPLGFKGH